MFVLAKPLIHTPVARIICLNGLICSDGLLLLTERRATLYHLDNHRSKSRDIRPPGGDRASFIVFKMEWTPDKSDGM